MLTTTLTTANDQAITSTAYTSQAGNVKVESRFGNFTGRAPPTYSIGVDLKPTSPTEQVETRYEHSNDGRNLMTWEQRLNDIRIHYNYKPGTNLLASKFTDDANNRYNREFYEYDQDHFLIRSISDDGAAAVADHRDDVTFQHITTTIPRKVAPAIGFPDQVFEVYWNAQKGHDCLLRRVQYTYNSADQVVREDIYDADNHFQYALTYDYDDKRNLLAQTDALGRLTRYTYDANKNKLSEELVDVGIRTHFRYDLMNRLVSQVESHPDGTVLTTTYTYDYLGNKVSEVDTFGNETRFTYDEFGRLIETVFPVQETLSGSTHPTAKRSYNILDQCVRETDAHGNSTETSYTVNNLPINVVYPDGTRERREYNLDGTLAKHWTVQGLLTQYTYDCLGRPLEKSEYDDNGTCLATTRWEYQRSQLKRRIDPLGVVTEYFYDPAGRKSAEVCEGSRAEFAYDALGHLTHTKSFFGPGELDYTVSIQEFDFLDRVIEDRMEDAFGRLLQKKAYQYDVQGNRTHEFLYHSESEFTVSEVRYNTRKQPIQIIDAKGASSQITYNLDYRNTLGQRVLLKTTTDPLGQQVIEEYDASGRLVAATTRDAFGVQLAGYKQIYDAVGNCVRRIDDIWTQGLRQNQRITDSTFDVGKRITHLCEAVGTSDQRSTHFSYNGYGQLSSIRLPDTVTLYHTYDVVGRLKTYHASDHSFDYRYEYDSMGNLLKVCDLATATTTTRSYDGLGHIISETLGNGLRLDYTYDGQGRPTSLTLPDISRIQWKYSGRCIQEIQRDNKWVHRYTKRDLLGHVLEMTGPAGTVSYAYDSLQRPIAINSSVYQEQIPTDGFDAVGNLLKHRIVDIFGARDFCYQYDGLYQLLSEDGAKSQTYTYDSLYNRLSKGTEQYSVNVLHSLLQVGMTRFVNNARGNPLLRQDGAQSIAYQYDALGRLISVEKDNAREKYLYDSFNRRLSAYRSIKDSSGDWVTQSALHFLYTDQNEIGAADSDGKIVQLRILGDGRGAEIGAAVTVELHDVVYTPMHDLRGNVVAIVDSHGTAVESLQYSAFGEENCIADGLTTTTCPWHFSSKRFDEFSGLTCFGRRYYDSGLGRWLTPDPIGYKAGPNLYAYVNNGPLTHLDLYGLWTQKRTHRDCDYSAAGPVGQGYYNALSDPVGTLDRYRSYASQFSSAILNRDFSSLLQKWDRIDSFSNFAQERMVEIVMLGCAGTARAGVTAARGIMTVGQRFAGIGSLAVRAGARWAYGRLSGRGVSAEVQSPPGPSTLSTQRGIAQGVVTRNSIREYLLNLSGVSKNELVNDIKSFGLDLKSPSNIKFMTFKDKNGIVRIKIHPPDKTTLYDHIHLYNKSGDSLDKFLNTVKRTSPDAHIPYGGPF